VFEKAPLLAKEGLGEGGFHSPDRVRLAVVREEFKQAFVVRE